MKNKNLGMAALAVMIAVAAGIWFWAADAQALKYPHNKSYIANPVGCAGCHQTTAIFRSITALNDSMCLKQCHNDTGKAGYKEFGNKYRSNRFNSVANYSSTRPVSHGWKIPNTNANAGATVGWQPTAEFSGWPPLSGRIYCSRCHRAHGDMVNVTIYGSFLKGDPKGDQICFNCHEARRISNVRDAKASNKHYSHPVEVNYSTARANKPTFFKEWPENPYPTNPSAALRLYTAATGTKNAVLCKTCHGPMHAADSNPYTFDSLTTYGRTGNYSSNAGNLLRRYPMSKKDDICTSCHNVTAHKGYKCNRCHTPHKKAGENNRYLILENISTPNSNIRPVLFISTSAMAQRWTNQGIGGISNAICQVCHTTTKWHRNYSTLGPTGKNREGHATPNEYLGSLKYRACVGCHTHDAGFGLSGAACGSCHGNPAEGTAYPADTYGKHDKHIGKNTGSSYAWSAGTLTDDRQASAYGFSCGRCHSPWVPYTALNINNLRHAGAAPGALRIYTADIGFKNGTPLPANSDSNAGYTYSVGGAQDNGGSGSDNYDFRGADSAPTGQEATCRNLYCHGQFYNGYTSNNPVWNGSGAVQACGACHGAKRSTPPGNTGGSANNWGAHPRHVGNANNQQYGFSGWKFGCNACHYPTTMTSITSIDDRSKHVDGRVTLEFAGGGYGEATSKYDGYVDYTSRKPAFTNPFANSKPAYKSCGLIYCHSDGSRMSNYSAPFNAGMGTGSAKFPNWSSTKNFTTTINYGGKTFKRRCSRCHGNSTYAGITAAMPGATSKGNSHTKHVIDNGFMCYVCHNQTLNTDNKSILSTTKHVNKTYDVDIVSTYGGTYSNGTCSNVKCHGLKTTPQWGNSAVCQNCHLSQTKDADKRVLPRSRFTSWTSTVPMIYSSQWQQKGHGSATINRSCDKCHDPAEKHGLSTNPFRLFTAADRPNVICESCHGTNATNPNKGVKTGIQTHASSVTGGGSGQNYAVKCIDCHDPHGDNNKFMVHSTLPRPFTFAGKEVASGKYGILTSNRTDSNVDFTNNVYTSDYARKYTAPKVCQVCHDETKNPTDSNSRFRWNGTADTPHGSGRCIDCHQHSSGFKGAGCNGCHGNPPTGTFNLLSGAGRINNISKRASGSATYGAHTTHMSVLKAAGLSATQACSACHYSGMWGSGAENGNIDIEFRAFTDYSGTLQEFNSGTGTKTGFYGISGIGVGSGTDNRCSVKCHGASWLTANYGNVSTPVWGNTSRVKCGNCHGAKKAAGVGSWPTSNRHAKHAGSAGTGYDMACKLCHTSTIASNWTTLSKATHVNGQAAVGFDTADAQARVDSFSTYSGDTKVNSGFGKCGNTYCHSNGTDTTAPYSALPNYTAVWNRTATATTGTGKECSLCHGSKVGAGGYAGITSAMPNYPSGSPKINSHKKHVVDNGFSCYACHAATVDSTGRAISSTVNHVNRTPDVSFPSKYDAGGASYSSNKCTNIKCHGGRITPTWGTSTIGCSDCHYSNTADTMSYTFNNWTDTPGMAKIYSTEWRDSGHGKSGSNYNRTNNAPAGKNCNTCHVSSVKHNTGSNYFRLTGLGGATDPSRLCKKCHGTGSSQLQTGWFGNKTGIQGHTQQILSASGYTNLTTWRFAPKCTDCHDPHGDGNASTGNIAMIRNTVLFNLSGSDSSGKPIKFPNLSTVNFQKYTGANSFDNNDGTKGRICVTCHKRTAHNGNGTGHTNGGLDCRTCHKHSKGFTPAGCTGCHGDNTRLYDRASWAPPKGPSGWSDSMSNKSSLHLPHANNPRSRPGFNNLTGLACQYCHDDVVPAGNHNSAKTAANMNNLTSTTGYNGYSKLSKITFGMWTTPSDDTCQSTKCHTPRSYTRQWRKPTDCDDCHGTIRLKGSATRVYNLHTTQSHKIHINYTGTLSLPASWKKNYRMACTNCHYDWATTNNYSTHYNSFVNITANGPINTVANMNTKVGQFYSKGSSFKGFTTGNESLGTCARSYCHGNFVNGTAITVPNWKKGVTAMKCASCHTAKTAAWDGGTADNMKGRHPKHVGNTAGYNFACSVCHVRTVSNNTTISFNPYSSHVNGRKDIFFGSAAFGPVSGVHSSGNNTCQTSYCHSRGSSQTAPYAVANYTADWDDTASGKTSGKPCGYCHGDRSQPFGGITAAMPNQANQAHAKHARNTAGDSFRCYVCHANVVSAAGAIISNTNHVNKFKNISIIGTYKSGQTLYSTTVPAKKTCKNVRCHGGLRTPLWTITTGTIVCLDCHKGTADTDKRISANNVFQSYSGKNAGAVPKIYTGQWLQKGHGKTSGNYSPSGNAAANKACTDCHGTGASGATKADTRHGAGTNRFRLLTAPDRPNVVCDKCHGTGGSASKNGIFSHASSVTKQGHSYAMKCIDCHDPHGDNNAYMVHSTIARPSNLLTRKESSNASGSLFNNATGRNVDFTARNYTTDYAKKTQADKICQVCHTQTYKPTTTSKTRFRWNGTNDLSHGTDRCTGCHSHSGGFKGVACNGCHGMPPVGTTTLIGGSANPGEPTSGSSTAGAHATHIAIYGSSGDQCSKCHYSGMWSSGAMNDNIDLDFKAFGLYTGAGQDYNSGTGARNGFYGISGVGAGAASDNTCASMKCHGGGNWLTSNLNNITTPRWTDPAGKIKCGNCHGAKKAAGQGTWPTSAAHAVHAGTGTGQQNFMCNLCHATTVISNNTTVDDGIHVNGKANVSISNDARVDGNSVYSDANNNVNDGVFGKCTNTYCHSKGTDSDMVAPYNGANDFSNWSAVWNVSRGSYRPTNVATDPAKCNYCHGNRSFGGITAAMPNYPSGTPKDNRHPMHVRTYNFLCNACHVDVARNNTSISNSGLHIDRNYDVNYTTVRGKVNNSAGTYTSGRCENTYCHSAGNVAANTQSIYTAKWSSNRGSYYNASAGMAKCNYCHGNKSMRGMTSAMPNYASGSPKANAHSKHVTKYGFVCKDCHYKVTTNNSSIDASGGIAAHVNKDYNVYFNPNVPGRQQVNTGIYKYQSGSVGGSCKNTYCHSRGTDFTRPYGTRTSFSNFTAQWGDNLQALGYKRPKGQKAKCNYCHGNRAYAGTTSAMPNYSGVAGAVTAKPNSHNKHVVGYGYGCKGCHQYVSNSNTSIDSASARSLHANGLYNVDFSNTINNNTGIYRFLGLGSQNKCVNTYCHSRGTDFTKPYATRTSFANFTARWGDNRGSYKQAAGLKAKCNYCHGNRAYAGTTSAMPNYSGNFGASKAKANSHRVHVVGSGYTCSKCHYGVVRNNTSISDSVRHANAFYNISFEPGVRGSAGKMYSSVWGAGGVQGTAGGTCMNVSCHGTSKPVWGNQNTASCKSCHLSSSLQDLDSYGKKNDGKTARLYSTEWGRKGHAAFGRDCGNCHNSAVAHGNESQNPFRLFTSDTNAVCGNCHGTTGERNRPGWSAFYGGGATKIDIKTHSKANTTGDASWNNFQNNVVKCVDCHDPHGDKNKKMIHSMLNMTGSDRFGRPSNAAFNQVSSIYSVQMTFTTWGSPTVLNWSSFANTDVTRSVCRRCHTSNAQDSGMGNQAGGNMTKANYAGAHQTHQACTGCHSHNEGFKGGGESTGDQSCSTCHSNLFNPMNSGSGSYHHVLQNTSAYAGTGDYPTGNGIADPSPKRRCLMCHVDHNVFKDQAWPSQGGRAANLRANINTAPAAVGDGVRSDWSGTDSSGGICLSCHTVAQTKNQTKQFNDGSTKTLRLFTSMYRNTPHNYTAIGNIATDGSRFKANCVKCHNDTMTKDKFASQTTTGFGVHDSKLRRINSMLGVTIDSGTATAVGANTLTDTTKAWTANAWVGQPVTIMAGTGKGQTRVVSSNTATALTMSKNWSPSLNTDSQYTIGDPVEENYCYNCHGVSQNRNFAQGKDYYGMVNFVNTKALKMEQTFSGDAGTLTGTPTTTSLADSTKSWSTNVWAGYIVKITSGKQAGKETTIASNTANTLTLSPALAKAPAAADGYAIGNPFRHRIDSFGGQHRSDEALTAPGSVTAFGWFTSIGTDLHVGCADCHNPHAQVKPASDRFVSSNTLSSITTVHDTTKNWVTNQWVGFKLVPINRNQVGEERVIISNTATKLKVDAAFAVRYTGVYSYIYPLGRAKVATAAPSTHKGNMLNGPNNGQWGAKPTAWNSTAPSTSAGVDNVAGGAVNFSKITTLRSGSNYIYELCFKCHSQYGFGSSGTPFNTMGGNFGSEGASTNISAEFNPNNLAHHALVDIGKNQPITATGTTAGTASYYNANWPKYTTGNVAIATTGVATFTTNVFSTVKSAIPGWFIYYSNAAPGQGLTTNWYQITEITGANTAKVTPPPASAQANAAYMMTAGLGSNFVPPYGPWSVVSCADCHDTDGANDPKGPHGSGQKWLLKGFRKQTFAWWNGSAMQTTSYGPAGNGGGTNDPAAYDQSKMICLNCHRADVYGFNANTPAGGKTPAAGGDISGFAYKGNWSRQTHTPDLSDGRSGQGTYNPFTIYCMNCHLGNAMGQVHGTNMGTSLNIDGTTLASPASWRGKRFLTGGAWVGIKRGSTTVTGTCYVKMDATVVPDTVNGCNDNITGALPAGNAFYDYETASDY